MQSFYHLLIGVPFQRILDHKCTVVLLQNVHSGVFPPGIISPGCLPVVPS